MLKLYEGGAYLVNGNELIPDTADALAAVESKTGVKTTKEEAAKGTMAYGILSSHNTSGNMENLRIKFDKLTSHDITFVGILQTARASGLEKFPVPYVLTNCHNSLCAVGGTINEDDHVFGLSCAKKYGGIYVPPHQAVIHQFAREMLAAGGAMILGSDSHTRYGALGTMAVGEGGPEIVKQLLEQTYDIPMPGVVAIHLTGKPAKGVGPQDIALAIIGAVFKNGYVNNKVMEFVGEGIDNLSVDYRIGVDVMTTETTCLSSIWRTDRAVEEFYEIHDRKADYKELNPAKVAYYDGVVEVDLSEIKPMIAMPFHPSNVYTIDELNANLEDILRDVEKKALVSLDNNNIDFKLTDKIHNGRLYVEQGVIAGCAGGGYENLCDAADILRGKTIGSDEFSLSVYPASQPIFMELVKNGRIADFTKPKYFFDKSIYDNRVYNGLGKADPSVEIKFGPNIVDWPEMHALTDNVLLKVVSMIHDPVTTTDELIPSGETSSYRSNPLGLAEFTLSRKDPAYVGKAKEVQKVEKARIAGEDIYAQDDSLKEVYETIQKQFDVVPEKTEVGSVIFAVKPGDGSAREQAASCQRVLGGMANIAREYATKRYRSNLINWGMLPFVFDGDLAFDKDDYIFVKDIKKAIETKEDTIKAYVVNQGMKEIELHLGNLTDDEREIILKGCLINYNKKN